MRVHWLLVPAFVITSFGCKPEPKADVPKDLNKPLPPPPVGAGGEKPGKPPPLPSEKAD